MAREWLENFYYLGVFSFAAGPTIALGKAILTISNRILIAARVNIAQSLRHEYITL
jgi:hypothetical protein